jgi:pimeloyl-ACP methyl ester carboxylesterase
MIALAGGTVTSTDGTTIGYRTVGAGVPVAVVGGALRTAEDYLPLANMLAGRFEVHVIDRRGRGASGPLGSSYSIDRECDDLEAVLAATGAMRVFGHSYGGLVALETAKRTAGVTHIAVYEPGVSVSQSIPTAWMPEYRQRLARGDTRGAFAAFARGAGHAPAFVSRLPLGYFKLVLRAAIKPEQWRRMEPLLEANLREHEEVQRLDSTVRGYEQIAARVLLLGGARSPASSKGVLAELERVIPHSALELIEGVGHDGPEAGSPARVAKRLEELFASESLR